MADVLQVVAINVASVTIDPARARVTCDVTLHVTTDAPLSMTLTGCGTYAF